MKKKDIFVSSMVTLSILVIIFYFVTVVFSEPERNLEKVSSEVSLNSNELVASFLTDEEKSNELYVDKILEVVGFVKEVTFLNKRITVLLYSKNNDAGIICDIDKNQIEKVKTLKKHQEIKIKGICKGFLKDVVLLNCYIDLKTNE
ncbi:hypothetical protein [uncultured Polaribacter sp.]|uniref:OB-fold protein n=1 Tax=uncultured Polaribacter sp. TaxID=174711 RepID=UPI002627AE6F|nr:hypothetical protein [uncultured Polaribacter sp.]